jgi:hypothetical protein
MKRGVLLGLGIFVLLSGNAFALDKCPAASLTLDDIVKAIEAAKSCPASYDIMNACRFNAGGDVQLAEVVIKKCEARFLAALPAKRRQSYERARMACRDKYAHEQGTMYVSFAVSCEAEVAIKYEKKWGR